jgi:hypothetical protein
VVGLLPLASGLACLWMEFPPFLMKQLYSCDSIVISSFVRAGYTTRWGWLLGRIWNVMKHYSPTGRRNYGRPLKRLLDMWDWNGSTSGPTPWQIYDDDGSWQKTARERFLRRKRMYVHCL